MHCDGDGQEDEDFSLYPRQSTIFPGKLGLTALRWDGLCCQHHHDTVGSALWGLFKLRGEIP